jgi:hypothetical protein
MFAHILLVVASLQSRSLSGGVHCVAEFAERGLRSYNVDLYLLGTEECWILPVDGIADHGCHFVDMALEMKIVALRRPDANSRDMMK